MEEAVIDTDVMHIATIEGKIGRTEILLPFPAVERLAILVVIADAGVYTPQYSYQQEHCPRLSHPVVGRPLPASFRIFLCRQIVCLIKVSLTYCEERNGKDRVEMD